MKVNLLLYAVTDRSWLKERESLAHAVEKALKGGVTMVQLREKECGTEELIKLAREVKAVCGRYKVPLLINDNIEAAKVAGADGVHLGQNDRSPREARAILGDQAIIGVTAKTIGQARKAKEDGANYIGTGAVFSTSTKSDAIGIPHERITEIKNAVDIPMTAIGGISLENAGSLKGRGMDGIAVVSALFAADDIEQAARERKKKAYEITGKMPVALTIAGSDSCGGAGIQADLKTFTANGVFGESVVTAVTAQNTRGVMGIYDIPKEGVSAQLDAVFSDIFPDAVKVGMVSSTAIIQKIAEKLKTYRPRFVVVDPVMVSTSGSRLLAEDAITALTKDLFPLADLLTPNLHEAQLLCGMKIQTKEDMVLAARNMVSAYRTAVLIKGGHLNHTSDDLYYDGQELAWFPGEKIENHNTHGTGCTLSSAIAAGLAKDMGMLESIKKAKEYISGAIAYGLNLGQGHGPMWHGYNL